MTKTNCYNCMSEQHKDKSGFGAIAHGFMEGVKGASQNINTGFRSTATEEERQGRPAGRVVLIYETGWKESFLHFSTPHRGWTRLPGLPLSRRADVDQFLPGSMVIAINDCPIEFVLNDGHNHWDHKDAKDFRNYKIDQPGVYSLRSGKLTLLHEHPWSHAPAPAAPREPEYREAGYERGPQGQYGQGPRIPEGQQGMGQRFGAASAQPEAYPKATSGADPSAGFRGLTLDEDRPGQQRGAYGAPRRDESYPAPKTYGGDDYSKYQGQGQGQQRQYRPQEAPKEEYQEGSGIGMFGAQAVDEPERQRKEEYQEGSGIGMFGAQAIDEPEDESERQRQGQYAYGQGQGGQGQRQGGYGQDWREREGYGRGEPERGLDRREREEREAREREEQEERKEGGLPFGLDNLFGGGKKKQEERERRKREEEEQAQAPAGVGGPHLVNAADILG